jgi:hypothetical protein
MSRKKHAEAHENHERWLVSYADFITLLFAFFVVMYAVSSVNEGKFRVLADSMMVAFRSSNPSSLKPIQLGGMVGTASRQAVGQASTAPSVAPDLRPLPASIIQRAPRVMLSMTRGPALTGGSTPVLAGELKPTARAVGKTDGDPNLAKVAAKLQEHLSDLIRSDVVNLRSSDVLGGGGDQEQHLCSPVGAPLSILRQCRPWRPSRISCARFPTAFRWKASPTTGRSVRQSTRRIGSYQPLAPPVWSMC